MWQGSGAVKPFVSDKLGVFVFLRVYLFVRVVRDYTDVYARRRLIYDNGYTSLQISTCVSHVYLLDAAIKRREAARFEA